MTCRGFTKGGFAAEVTQIGDVWYVQCSCGWWSAPIETDRKADQKARVHLRKTHSPGGPGRPH
jgi:hypothetical protein